MTIFLHFTVCKMGEHLYIKLEAYIYINLESEAFLIKLSNLKFKPCNNRAKDNTVPAGL